MKHIEYLLYVLRHKWYVLVACCHLGVPWLGVLHDWSKFMPDEWGPYAVYFFSKSSRADKESAKPAFDLAWLAHQRRNPHHWQYWVMLNSDGSTKVFPMPDKYRREMLADWEGAGRAKGQPDVQAWYRNNRHAMMLHEETRAWIEGRLGVSQS